MILGKIFFLCIFIQKVKVTPLNQFRELQIFRLFPCQNSCTGNAGTGIEILCFCSAHPLGSFGQYQKVISTSYIIGIAQVLKPPNHSLHPTWTLRRKADLCRKQELYDDDNFYSARARKLALLVIFGQILAFLPYLMPRPTKKK